MVPLQLATPAMMLFARRFKHALDVTVQCFHDADPRKHRRPAFRRDQEKGLHRGLPFRRFVLGLRKLGDVCSGILERDEFSATRKRDWLVEGAGSALSGRHTSSLSGWRGIQDRSRSVRPSLGWGNAKPESRCMSRSSLAASPATGPRHRPRSDHYRELGRTCPIEAHFPRKGELFLAKSARVAFTLPLGGSKASDRRDLRVRSRVARWAQPPANPPRAGSSAIPLTNKYLQVL
jgi:hypothetical protein